MADSTCTIAVTITCFNRKQKTLAALAAVRRQDLPANVSLDIYLTDAGSDGTAQSVLKLYPESRVIKADESVYWVHGMEMSWREAIKDDPDYYLWLNDDTYLHDDAVSRLLSTAGSVFGREQGNVIVAGATADPESGEVTYGGWCRDSWWHPLRFRLLKAVSMPQRVDTINGNCVLIPRSTIRDIGTLDLVFQHVMGDWDYGLRANRAGCTTWIAPGLIGICAANSLQGTWQDTTLRLKKRWQLVRSPKGLPPAEWRTMTKRHAGPFWPYFWLRPYARVVITSLLSRRLW